LSRNCDSMDIERPLLAFAAHSPTSGRAEVNKLDLIVHVIRKNSRSAVREHNDTRAETPRP
jgi:hypothetical protein